LGKERRKGRITSSACEKKGTSRKTATKVVLTENGKSSPGEQKEKGTSWEGRENRREPAERKGRSLLRGKHHL